jgi:hypothetical protein
MSIIQLVYVLAIDMLYADFQYGHCHLLLLYKSFSKSADLLIVIVAKAVLCGRIFVVLSYVI